MTIKASRLQSMHVLWVLLFGPLCSGALAGEPIRLHEMFSSGYQYHARCRVEVSGNLNLPAEKPGQAARPLTVTGSSAIEYDERILATDADGRVQKTMRIYRQIDFQRKVGEQLQESTVRPGVRRLVVLRDHNLKVPFSP